MIVKGNFQSVTMALYGQLVTDVAPSPETYEPRHISSKTYPTSPLPPQVDPSNAADPTLLARQLLELIPDAPPLPLVVRLMMCLKPTNDDWDSPDFPYLLNDLDEAIEDFDLAKAFQCVSKPVLDDTPHESMERFSERIASSIGPKVSVQRTNSFTISIDVNFVDCAIGL